MSERNPDTREERRAAVGFIVRQSTTSGAMRVLLETDDEELARIVFSLRKTAARRGVYTELVAGDELLDAEISERAFAFKARGRAARQGSLF